MTTRQPLLTTIDYLVYHRQDVRAAGQRNGVRRRIWCIPGLDAEIPNPADFRSAPVGQAPVVLVRGQIGCASASVKGIRVDHVVALRRANVFPEPGCRHLMSRSWITRVVGNTVTAQTAMPVCSPAMMAKQAFSISANTTAGLPWRTTSPSCRAEPASTAHIGSPPFCWPRSGNRQPPPRTPRS